MSNTPNNPNWLHLLNETYNDMLEAFRMTPARKAVIDAAEAKAKAELARREESIGRRTGENVDSSTESPYPRTRELAHRLDRIYYLRRRTQEPHVPPGHPRYARTQDQAEINREGLAQSREGEHEARREQR